MCGFQRTSQFPQGNPNSSVGFTDDLTEKCQLKSVSVEAAQWVAFIQCTWKGVDGNIVQGARHGSSHGDPVGTFDLEDGEFVTKVEGYYGKYVNFLKFTTSRHKTYQYGTAGGAGNSEFVAEGVVSGFFGFAQASLDCLGFFVPANPPCPHLG
jgi:hypothetical protein